MSEIEPAKLKVTELRDELKKRGLDAKGNKAQLVKRLEKALQQDISGDVEAANTSAIADGSLNQSSQLTSEFASTEPDEKAGEHSDSQREQPSEQKEELQKFGSEAEDLVPEQDEMPEVKPLELQDTTDKEMDVGENVKVEPTIEQKVSTETMVNTSLGDCTESASVMEIKPEEPDSVPESTEDDQQSEVIMVDDSKRVTDEQTTEESGHREHRKRSRSPSDDKHRTQRSRSPRRSRHSRSRSRSIDRRQDRSRSRSRDREQLCMSGSPEKVEPVESDDWLAATNVQLDRYICDLSLAIDVDGYQAHPMTNGGFAFMWSGVRSTYGVTCGKVCFEVKLLEQMHVGHLPAEEPNPHVLRVGFSTGDSLLQLGEEKRSYGYGGTGKASTDCKFKDYGQEFSKGDVIAAFCDLTNDPYQISFAKNGEDLGTCFEVESSELDGQALFPHILTKNCSFECNFGQMETPFFPAKEGFVFINLVPEVKRIRGMLPPKKKKVPTATRR